MSHKFAKAIGGTFGCLILVYIVFFLVSLAFRNMSVDQSATWIIICFSIVILFTVIFCTLTILEEIRKHFNGTSKEK